MCYLEAQIRAGLAPGREKPLLQKVEAWADHALCPPREGLRTRPPVRCFSQDPGSSVRHVGRRAARVGKCVARHLQVFCRHEARPGPWACCGACLRVGRVSSHAPHACWAERPQGRVSDLRSHVASESALGFPVAAQRSDDSPPCLPFHVGMLPGPLGERGFQ